MKYFEFLHIASLINQILDTTPLLFGSLGLEKRLNKNLDADDIDVLIPEMILNKSWNRLIDMMKKDGYRLCNEKEHEFIKNDIRVVFASVEGLVAFAQVDISSISLIEENGIRFYLLELDDYLKVYRASSKDGYRKNVKNKQDQKKIELIEKEIKS